MIWFIILRYSILKCFEMEKYFFKLSLAAGEFKALCTAGF